MAKVKVHYANFDHYGVTANRWGVSISTGFFFGSKHITGSNIARIEVATTQSVKRFGAATGWGIVGGAVAGPLGMVAGAVLGGNGSDTTFILETEDGKQLIGTVATNVFNALVREKLRFDELKKPLYTLGMMEADRRLQEAKDAYDLAVLADAKEAGRPVELIDLEMETKVSRALYDADYQRIYGHTGQIDEIRAYAERTRYVIPEGKTL